MGHPRSWMTNWILLASGAWGEGTHSYVVWDIQCYSMGSWVSITSRRAMSTVSPTCISTHKSMTIGRWMRGVLLSKLHPLIDIHPPRVTGLRRSGRSLPGDRQTSPGKLGTSKSVSMRLGRMYSSNFHALDMNSSNTDHGATKKT